MSQIFEYSKELFADYAERYGWEFECKYDEPHIEYVNGKWEMGYVNQLIMKLNYSVVNDDYYKLTPYIEVSQKRLPYNKVNTMTEKMGNFIVLITEFRSGMIVLHCSGYENMDNLDSLSNERIKIILDDRMRIYKEIYEEMSIIHHRHLLEHEKSEIDKEGKE